MNEEMKQDNHEKLDMLLDFLEHPENYTESQRDALLNDAEVKELYQQMVETREAIDYQKSWEEMAMPSVSEEWEKLKKVKSGEWRVKRVKSEERGEKNKERRVKGEKQRVKNGVVSLWFPVRKVAAAVAILIVSGIAFAAIRMATRQQREAHSLKPRQAIVRQDSLRQSSTFATTKPVAKADTAVQRKLPLLYENAELQSILSPIAEHFHVSVSYHKESARHIRLYLQLADGMTLEDIVELMNHFEKVNIKHEGNALIVE